MDIHDKGGEQLNLGRPIILGCRPWRTSLLDVIAHPSLYGISVRGAWPKEFILCMDETPLCYLPKRRTYAQPSGPRRRIYFSNDKRQITATPVANMLGAIVMFQLIWRGLTSGCTPYQTPPRGLPLHHLQYLR